MKLHITDCHLGYARLALAQDDADTAREHVAQARALIEDTGELADLARQARKRGYEKKGISPIIPAHSGVVSVKSVAAVQSCRLYLWRIIGLIPFFSGVCARSPVYCQGAGSRVAGLVAQRRRDPRRRRNGA